MTRDYIEGHPQIKMLPDGYGSYAFWCPFCKCWHHHGGNDGHRVAQCGCHAIMRGSKVVNLSIESPFKDRGYYLMPMTKTELKHLRKCIDLELNRLDWEKEKQ